MSDTQTEKYSPDQKSVLSNLEFSNGKKFPTEIKERITELLRGKTDDMNPTRISADLKDMLTKDFGLGWCVVVGGHFSGAFTYLENYYQEIKCGELMIVVFKTYVPPK